MGTSTELPDRSCVDIIMRSSGIVDRVCGMMIFLFVGMALVFLGKVAISFEVCKRTSVKVMQP